MIIQELALNGGGTPFSLYGFLESINMCIPQTLPLSKTIETIHKEKRAFEDHPKLREHVDDYCKIYLIGPRKLPDGYHPREKTLRKLYLYLEHSGDTVARFIDALKRANMTVAWTDDKTKANLDILKMMGGIAPQGAKTAA